jgi:hypothetical protein
MLLLAALLQSFVALVLLCFDFIRNSYLEQKCTL